MITSNHDNDDIIIDEDIVNFCLFAGCDLVFYEDAMTNERQVKVMDDKIHLIEKNDTCKLTSLPPSKKPIRVKWVCKTMYKLDGQVDLLKVRLVVKGHKQKLGVDYFEVFVLVSKIDTIQMIVALTTQ